MRYSMKRLLFAVVLRPVHRWLAQSFDWTRDMTGCCWHSKFFFSLMGDRHPVTAIHCVKLHLVRAGLVREAESYQRDLTGSAEYAVNGRGAGCGISGSAGTWSSCRPAQGPWAGSFAAPVGQR